MATINGVPFRKNLVPSSKYNIKCPYPMNPKKITIHCTDNQAPAANEINYMINNNNQTSYHIAIDEKEAVQGLPFNRNGWHAGDGRNGYGNRNTIGVEMCRSYDRSRKTTKLNEPLKSQFSKTFENTIKVVAKLCIDLGIVANESNIKQHRDWSGKYCPRKILDDKSWNELVDGIIKEYNRLKNGASGTSKGSISKSSKQSSPSKSSSVYKGNSIVDYLNSLGIDSSPANRRKLAKKYGVKNYDLSAAKNLELLNKMRSGKKPAQTSSSTSASKTSTTHTTFKVGGKATIKPTAKTYATGEPIPSRYKGKTFTIQQIKSDRVLLKELYSWVRNSDLVGGSSSSSSISTKSSKSSSKSNSSTSIRQIALKIIRNPKAPKGHEARRKWLGVDKQTYEKVRKEVNKLMK